MMDPQDDDDTAEVLAQMAADDIDLSQPMAIDFMVAAPDEEAATAIHAAILAAGYEADVVFDEGEPDEDGVIDPDDEEFGPSWTVYTTITMVPTHDEITRIEEELDQIAAPFDGYADGWGAMGTEDDEAE